MKIEVSIGEIVDKLSILRIKKNNITDAEKLKNVVTEYDYLYSIVFDELKIDSLTNSPLDTNFVHTGYFAVLDKNMQLRGVYDGLNADSLINNPSSLSKLSTDVGYLMLEKDKRRKSEVFQQIIELSWLWLIIAVLVTGFVYYFTKTRQKY